MGDGRSDPLPIPCELRMFRSGQRRILWLGVLLGSLTLVESATQAILPLVGGPAAWPLWERVQMGLVGASTLYLALTSLRIRIRLEASRIVVRTGVPGWLQWVQQDAVVPVAQIRSAYFDRSPLGQGGAVPWRLVLETTSGVRFFPALGWVYDGPFGEVIAGAPPWWNAKHRAGAVRDIPFPPFLRQRGISVEDAPRPMQQKDLLRAPQVRGLLGAAAVLVGYAALEGLVGSETYAAPEAAGTTAVWVGITAVIVVALLLRRGGRLERIECAAVAAVAGIALAIASYPAALRINQLSDAEGLIAHRYLQHEGDLLPATEEAPTLDFWFKADYVALFEEGREHVIHVRRGGLGFVQLRKSDLAARMRACHAGRCHPPAPQRAEAAGGSPANPGAL